MRAEGGVNLIVQAVDGIDGTRCSTCPTGSSSGTRLPRSCSACVEDGKVTLIANFDQSVADRVSASDVVKGAAALVGGGGGGRPTMARAGGKDPERLPDALAEAERLILEAP